MKSRRAAVSRLGARFGLTLMLCGFALAGSLLFAQANGELDPKVQTFYDEAKEAQARGDTAAAIANYESILKIAPRLAAAYNNLGLLYMQRGDYAHAVSVLANGLKVDPKMPSASALLGISLYEMHDYARARPRLEAAVRSNPKDDHAKLFLAKDLINLGELDAAATHLQELTHRTPQDQEVWYVLGTTYMRLSEKALSRMNAIDPNSALAHELSGEIMESMKNYDGAVVEYKKAVEMAPSRPGTQAKLGNAYWALSEWDAAMKAFQAELVNDPKNCTAQAQIGDILIEQRISFDEGLAAEEKALAICPNLTQAHVNRGRALLTLKRPEDAVAEFQIAEQATPDDPQVHFFLAQGYRSLGQTQKAQSEMQVFSKLEESDRANSAERAKQAIQEKEEAH